MSVNSKTSTYHFPVEVEAVISHLFYSVYGCLQHDSDCKNFPLSLTDEQKELIKNTNLFDYLEF